MLTMDKNEAGNHPHVADMFGAQLGGEFEVESLYSGDFAALDTPLALGIERKSFSNLYQSMVSGELDEQLVKLSTTYDFPVLLVEGLPVPKPNGTVPLHGAKKKVNYAWIVGTLASWYGRGVWPLLLPDHASLVPTVLELYSLATKSDHRDVYYPKQVFPVLGKAPLVARVMSQFPGVGPKRAMKLKGRRLQELANLDCEGWEKELGAITGRKVCEAWEGQD